MAGIVELRIWCEAVGGSLPLTASREAYSEPYHQHCEAEQNLLLSGLDLRKVYTGSGEEDDWTCLL